MLLRTRLILMFSSGLTLLIAGILAESYVRQITLEARYQTAVLDGYRTAWEATLNTEWVRISELRSILNRHETALNALGRHDVHQFAASLTPFIAEMQASPFPPGLEVTTADGAPFYRADTAVSKTVAPQISAFQVISPAIARHLRRTLTPLLGLVTLHDHGGYGLAIVFPLLTRSGFSGIAALYLALDPLLLSFAESTGDNVFIVHPDGSLAHRLQDTPADLLAHLRNIHRLLPYQTLSVGGTIYTRYAIPLKDVLEQEIATLLVLRNITPEYWQWWRWRGVSYLILIVVLALGLASLYWYLRHAFQPLNAVIQVLNALSKGNTRVTLNLTATPDEIGRLVGTVEHFRRAQRASQQLATLQQELDIAQRIQRSFWPTDFPQCPQFGLFAYAHPAREVGGDFYDFFEVPDGRWAVVIADVSGKGIGAALFMAVARTTLRTTATIVADPAACLRQTNDFLSQNNEAGMFVTLFYGLLSPDTGHFTYANGGHNPPYWVQGTVVKPLPSTHGMALGALNGLLFRQHTIELQPSDRLLLYTDGLTEAINVAQQEFTPQRLERLLAQLPAVGLPRWVQRIVDEVQAFAVDMPQFDDMTVVALEYRGPADAST